MHNAIERARLRLRDNPAMATFCKRSLLAFAFMANKLECTLPWGYEDFNTYKKLEEQLTQVRALLSHTVDTLEQERRLSAVTKNRVAGGY
ncbi:MAG: hypothetical protein EOM58_13040, partial [Clostridia bacterium]|nr:hypothetical protein [Clostridia bacterium]